MGQDFHVAADLLVGYPGIYLGGFQIRMPQKTAYGLDGHTVREQHGGGVRMPGNMIGQPYLETALPAKFLQYGVASAVARYRKYMIVLGQPLVLLYDAPGNVQQADVGLGVRLPPAGDDPEVAVEEGLEPVGRQRLHVCVCQSGKDREDEEVDVSVGDKVRAALIGGEFHRAAHLLNIFIGHAIALHEERFDDEFRGGAGLQRRHLDGDLPFEDIAELRYLILLGKVLAHDEVGVLSIKVRENRGVLRGAAHEVLLALDGRAEKGGDGEAKVALVTVGVDYVRDAAAGAARYRDRILRPHIGEGATERKPVAAGRSGHKLKLRGPTFLRCGGRHRGSRSNCQQRDKK